MRKWVILSLIVLLSLTAIIFSFFLEENSAQTTYSSKQLTTVKKGDIRKVIASSGYLKSAREEKLIFEINGKVTNINIKEGEYVSEDQILMRINNEQLKLNYLKAKNSFEKLKITGPKKLVREKEMNLKLAKKRLDSAIIRSPFSGVISSLYIEEGDYVSNNQVVANLIDTSCYEIKTEINELESKKIKIGQPVDITIDALSDKKINGKISSIAFTPKIKDGLVVIPISVRISQNNKNFKPGFSADLEIIVREEKNKIVVPITSIYRENGVKKVVKVVDNKLVSVEVTTGMDNSIQVIINKGLEENDKILTNAYSQAGINPEDSLDFLTE